jgi:endonuclease/exonuclease/phosphatase family metal-dependent hydrolase
MARKSNFDQVSAEILNLVNERDVDVFFLQEVQRNAGESRAIAEALAEALGFHCLFQTTDFWGDGGSQGLAILSRHPLQDTEVIPLKHFDLAFHQRNRIGLAATVLTPLGPVRAINAHLDARINTNERLDQLAGVLDSVARFDGSSVVGGDFNTGDFRWVTRWLPIPFVARQKDAVREALEERGFETPFVSSGATFKRLGLKLDWIFSKGLRPVASGIDEIRFSDHRAIWVTIE